jgi:hypothetical protein
MIIKDFLHYDRHYYNYIHPNNMGNYIEDFDKLYVGKSYVVVGFYDDIQRGTFIYKDSKKEPHLIFTLNFEGGIMSYQGTKFKEMVYQCHFQYNQLFNKSKIYECILDVQLKSEMNDYWRKMYTTFVVNICKNRNMCEDIEEHICSYL